MKPYYDTSFLMSLYIQDIHSKRAMAQFRSRKGISCLTSFQLFELQNAVRLSFFRKQITDEEIRKTQANIESDLTTGVFNIVPVSWEQVWEKAEALSKAHTAIIGIRSLDILHVAAALAIHADCFFTFDARQKQLAKKAGLRAPFN